MYSTNEQFDSLMRIYQNDDIASVVRGGALIFLVLQHVHKIELYTFLDTHNIVVHILTFSVVYGGSIN